MPRDEQPRLMPSVLDRLIDAGLEGAAPQPWYGVGQMVDAVQRDLEELLNTRETFEGSGTEFPEVYRSLAAYGLPDLTSLVAVTAHQREEIGRAIEAVVARFEPRLKDVRAVLLDNPDNKQRTVRYRIEARLSLDPAPDVAFDTTLELTTGYYTVRTTTS